MVNSTFHMINFLLFVWSTRLLIWSTCYFLHGQLCDIHIALRLDSNKMAANNEDAQHISSACAIAKQALEAIENLHNNDIRNVAALTATNRASTSFVPSSSPSIAAELSRRFPTFNARGATATRKRTSAGTFTSSMSRGNRNGRPSKTIFHKDLVIIPNPNTKQVPSHVNKVKLEERGLIVHQFPFNKDWTYLDLKRNIESQLPREDIMFEYLKVTYFWFLLLDKISN